MKRRSARRQKIDTQDILRRYKAGISGYQIAEEMGHSPATVYGRIRKAGETRPKGKRSSNIPLPEAADLYQAGENLTVLAKKYRCHIGTLSARLKAYGVKVRGRGYPKGQTHDGKLTLAQRAALDARILECRGTQLQIAKEHGCSREYVRQRAEKVCCTWYQIKIRATREHKTQDRQQAVALARETKAQLRDDMIAEMADMWRAGQSALAIAHALEMGRSAVANWIERMRLLDPDLFPRRRKPRTIRHVSHA